MKTKFKSCIEACQDCLVECQNCLMEMAGMDSMNDCPKCCVLCIDACYVSIKFMSADSEYAGKYCKLCAEICEWCAEECGEHDHEHCKQCARACRKCAEECEKMAA